MTNYINLTNDIDISILAYSQGKKEFSPIRFYCDNQGKRWVEARNNKRFAIKIKNNSYINKLVVVSIDGLNVISGDKASTLDKKGYVVPGLSSITIEGWRISDDKVKVFEFTNNENSYYVTKLTGESSNTGVIGVAIYEQVLDLVSSPWTSTGIFGDFKISWTCSNSTIPYNSAGTSAYSVSGSNNSPPISMGTKMGEKVIDSQVKQDYSRFSDKPSQIQEIFYDSHEGLLQKGILQPYQRKYPQAFSDSPYCPVL